MSPGSRPSHGTFPSRFPATSSVPPRITSRTPNPSRIFPRSRISLQQADLKGKLSLAAWRIRRSPIQMLVGGRCRAPPARRADDIADLQQEGLDHFGESLRLVVDRGSDGLQPHGTAVVLFDDRDEESIVEP